MKAPKKKRRAVPIYGRIRRLVDPATGEEVGAIVPAAVQDKNDMRRRKLHIGDLVRLEIKKPRNVGFHRLAHAIGGLVVENIEGFESLDHHGAIKRLQRECGAFCEEMAMDIPGLGQLAVKIPRSIAFDEMDEGDFTQLVATVCKHISAQYWPTLTPQQIETMAEAMVEA